MQNSPLFQNLTNFEVNLKLNDPVTAVSDILKASPSLTRLKMTNDLTSEQSKKLADYCLKEKKLGRVKTFNPLFSELITIYKNQLDPKNNTLNEKEVQQLVFHLQTKGSRECFQYLLDNPGEFPGIDKTFREVIKDPNTRQETKNILLEIVEVEKKVLQQAQAIIGENLLSPHSAQSPTRKASGNQPTQKSPHR